MTIGDWVLAWTLTEPPKSIEGVVEEILPGRVLVAVLVSGRRFRFWCKDTATPAEPKDEALLRFLTGERRELGLE